MNVQSLTDSSGELLYLGRARYGSTPDLTAARRDGLVDAAAERNIEVTAEKGYQGAGGTVPTPIKAPKGTGHNG